MIDIIYPAWNRLEFTKISFDTLAKNTNWSLVRKLIVYEDGSTDGTREYLDAQVKEAQANGINASLSYLGFGSPVRVMNHYLDREPAELFAKIDSDIACPPGWLESLLAVMDGSPELEILGMQAGMTLQPLDIDCMNLYSYQSATHIGGVGLMRSSAFLTRERPQARGRFGFTDWQQREAPRLGWITPDICCPQLDLLPFEPFTSLSAEYVEKGWQRHWPPYHPNATWIWDWLELSA